MYYDYYLYYLTYLSSLYNGYPFIVRMTVVMVSILVLVTIFGFIQLLYYGFKVRRQEIRRTEAWDFFEDKLMFVMQSKTIYELEEVQELLQYGEKGVKYWKGDVLTDLILTVKHKLNNEGVLNTINYKNCLEALHIMKFWDKRIRKAGLNKRKEALQVMGQINNGVNIGTLTKSTFHRDKHLRKTARELFTEYDLYNPFKFMEDNFDESFTSLDKLRLHATLIKRDKEAKLPNLLRWVNSSKNPEYIMFVLKEIAYFKQIETLPVLNMMLDRQERKDVKAQIIHTIAELNGIEYISSLIERFALESDLVRDAIIVAMSKLRNQIALNFLIKTYSESDDSSFKLNIARAIKSYGEAGLKVLKDLQSNVSNNLNEGTILEQVISESIVSTSY